MRERLFRFKRFSVAHEVSAMKVGVDGVLIGLWVKLHEKGRVLDAGTGCGVVSLIMAQRSEGIIVDGVEYDPGAADEAANNFARSPWSSRLESHCADWLDYARKERPFNLIVSNPPYYDDGVEAGDNLRLAARHVGGLSPSSLLRHANELLTSDGEIAMIFPAEYKEKLLVEARDAGLCLRRIALVSNHPGADVKRVMAQWSKIPSETVTENLILFGADKTTPTPEYRELGKEFYLKF